MVPALVVFGYLAIVLYIGIFAFRRGKTSGEDFFLASRSLGPYIFLLSLFGTNMTAFAILGSSGLSYKIGIGVFGLMASSSCFVIPVTIFFIGTRLWGLGKKFGHMTQVQYFRDRWECSEIGTVIFVLTAAMLVPYLIIGTMGGGETLSSISTYTDAGGQTRHWVSYEAGAGLVAVVVMSYVFFGGMRGTAWVNTFQTTLFLCFGAIAFFLISQKLGGFGKIMTEMQNDPKSSVLLTRARIPTEEFFSYMFIPLSSIMFPHIAIMCMTAERVTHFKKTVIFYPLCIAAIWLPAVYIGTIGAHEFPGLKPGDTDDIIPRMLREYTGPLVSGILGAGIMACVMASDSQILALCTMFTEDVFAYYGGKDRFGEKAQVWTGRFFIVLVTVVAYVIALALKDKEGIFGLAIRFAFSGFAAMAPVMLAALFWKRSTKYGALASTLWVMGTVAFTGWLHMATEGLAKPGQPPVVIYESLGNLFLRTPVNVTMYGFLPVMPMCIGSAILMAVVSLLTRPPSRATLDKYFPPRKEPGVPAAVSQAVPAATPDGVKAG
ncbi:MAG: sodium:solute symporter family protein [Planctomycetota bacterium]|nr:sodium:solute symporter family protein [Planctomycetota bacterium]